MRKMALATAATITLGSCAGCGTLDDRGAEEIIVAGMDRAVEVGSGSVAGADLGGTGRSSTVTYEIVDGTLTRVTGEGAWAVWPHDVAVPSFDGGVSVTGTRTDDDVWIHAAGVVDRSAAIAVSDYVSTLGDFDDIERGAAYARVTNGRFTITVAASDTPDNRGTHFGVTLVSA